MSVTSRRLPTRLPSILIVAATLLLAACHGFDVTDPTLIQDDDIANAGGANGRRLNALYDFGNQIPSMLNDVAVFTDERMYDPQQIPGAPYQDMTLDLDLRDEHLLLQIADISLNDGHLNYLTHVFTRTSVAIPAVRAHMAESVKGEYLAQLFALRGYVVVQMAEDICPGFPINDVTVDNLAVYSEPYTRDSALKYGVAQLDSALANGRDSTNFLNVARVVKGRALLDLGQYDQAAAVVAGVPVTFTYTTDPSIRGNVFFQGSNEWDGGTPLAVGDVEGGTGLPFVSDQDPRIPTAFRRGRTLVPTDSLYDQTKYMSSNDPVVLVSGIEARLIEAEADINAGNPRWFATLNTLRATMIAPAMTAITTMPTAKDDQLDLLYRERAFWLYLTGRRLGDLRRLVLNYGRAANTVFPTGGYPVLGLTYGNATAIPFSQAAEGQYNPKITAGCTVP